MENIRDCNKRKICELDPHHKVIIIKNKGSKTRIELQDNGTYKVVHLTK